MVRFLFDMIWFPFAIDHPKNKFGKVLNFVMKDFPAFFWIKPNFFKAIIFPFIVIWMIVRKEDFERFGTFSQLVIIVLLFLLVEFIRFNGYFGGFSFTYCSYGLITSLCDSFLLDTRFIIRDLLLNYGEIRTELLFANEFPSTMSEQDIQRLSQVKNLLDVQLQDFSISVYKQLLDVYFSIYKL